MTIKNSGTMIAVGLAMGVGGHELVLDGNQAQAASPLTEFVTGTLPQNQTAEGCGFEPSSGCFTLLPLFYGSPPPQPVGEIGTGYCLPSEGSDGSSGIACLSMGG
jgi:hypothetical protein